MATTSPSNTCTPAGVSITPLGNVQLTQAMLGAVTYTVRPPALIPRPIACSVMIADQYPTLNRSITESINVSLPALTVTPSPLKFTLGGSAQNITANEAGYNGPLSFGGNCSGIVSVSPSSGTGPSQVFAVSPVGAGSCTGTVSDNHGGVVPVPITVGASMASWPQQITMGVSGSKVSYVPNTNFDLAEFLNRTIGGGVAQAATTSGCYAYALTSTGVADLPEPAQATALGVYVDANGCYTNSSGTPVSAAPIVVYEPSGNTTTFSIVPSSTCTSSNVTQGAWNPVNPPRNVAQAALPLTGGSTSTTGCSIGITDGSTTPALDHGLTTVQVVGACRGVPCYANLFEYQTATATICTAYSINTGKCIKSNTSSSTKESSYYYLSNDLGLTWALYSIGSCSTATSNGSCTPTVASGYPPFPSSASLACSESGSLDNQYGVYTTTSTHSGWTPPPPASQTGLPSCVNGAP